MIYVIGIIGFIGGFLIGQMILYFMLRHKTRDELVDNKDLNYTYGIANWIMAAFGAYASVHVYQLYFPAT